MQFNRDIVKTGCVWPQTSKLEPDSSEVQFAPGGYPFEKETAAYSRRLEPPAWDAIEAQFVVYGNI